MTREEIILKLDGSRYDRSYMTTHARRYEKSLAALKRHVPEPQVILDIGWPTIFDNILDEQGYATFNGDWDIRKPWPRESKTVPVLLLMEVVEHLKDPEPGAFDTFTYDGLVRALFEAHRVIAPGGLLFLSTPNIASTGSISRLIKSGSPMLFTPHVREYAAKEIAWWVEQAGFKIVELTTQACYEDTDPAVLDLISKAGGDTTLRDDTTFLFATP
jgi:hypothetical protein